MSSKPEFVHLHVHSHFSLLDGASPLDKLVTRAKEHGMNGLALTDHGNLSGSLQFYSKCKSRRDMYNLITGYLVSHLQHNSYFDIVIFKAYRFAEVRVSHDSLHARYFEEEKTVLQNE